MTGSAIQYHPETIPAFKGNPIIECLRPRVRTTEIIKELADEKEGYIKTNNLERAKLIDEQAEIIKVYLPKQLTEEEIRAEISKLEDKSMPSIMKHFKANFAGKVDMSLVSRIARDI